MEARWETRDGRPTAVFKKPVIAPCATQAEEGNYPAKSLYISRPDELALLNRPEHGLQGCIPRV